MIALKKGFFVAKIAKYEVAKSAPSLTGYLEM
jgi:hypothetical protein